MDLHFKKPTKEARFAMGEAANQTQLMNKQEYIKSAQGEICKLTGHQNARVVSSGNAAILAVMSNFKGKILIPDQGGWTGFIDAAKFLGLETVELPTELGLINLNTLQEFIDKYKVDALFITSFAGYIAEQPVKDVFEICQDRGVILVEDASGGIGDKEKNLSNGDHAHVILASTGSPKIMNVGSGGFISSDNNNFLKKNRFILKTLKADPIIAAGIVEEARKAGEALSKYIDACNSIKKHLLSAIHRDSRGISVALNTEYPKKTGQELRKYLKADGRSIVTICPRYERVMIDAVCLEIKNLDPHCLHDSNINEIVEIVKEVMN